MNPHDQNHINLAYEAEHRAFRLLIIGVLAATCFLGGYTLGESRGYKEGLAARKLCPSPVALREMTQKQQVRHTKWLMRDKGAVK